MCNSAWEKDIKRDAPKQCFPRSFKTSSKAGQSHPELRAVEWCSFSWSGLGLAKLVVKILGLKIKWSEAFRVTHVGGSRSLGLKDLRVKGFRVIYRFLPYRDFAVQGLQGARKLELEDVRFYRF